MELQPSSIFESIGNANDALRFAIGFTLRNYDKVGVVAAKPDLIRSFRSDKGYEEGTVKLEHLLTFFDKLFSLVLDDEAYLRIYQNSSSNEDFRIELINKAFTDIGFGADHRIDTEHYFSYLQFVFTPYTQVKSQIEENQTTLNNEQDLLNYINTLASGLFENPSGCAGLPSHRTFAMTFYTSFLLGLKNFDKDDEVYSKIYNRLRSHKSTNQSE